MEFSETGTDVDALAEVVVLTACTLADAAGPGRWSPGAIEDAASALEVLAGTLARLDRESAELLAVVPVAVAALRDRVEQVQAGEGRTDGDAVRGAAGSSTALREALAVHDIRHHRVHQLGAALLTVTLEPADAQALAGLLAQHGLRDQSPRTDVGLWGSGLAGTAAAALGYALASYGSSSYARVLDSGQVSAGLTPQAARAVVATLTARRVPAASRGTRRRGLGPGYRGLGAPQ